MEEYIVELPDKQEIDREMVVLPKIPVRMACEQKEYVEEEICNMSLPKLFKVEESVHTDEIELKIPETNAVEIKVLPRKIKLEMPIEQSKSNLHTKWKKVLGSKVIRRKNSIKLIKRDM